MRGGLEGQVVAGRYRVISKLGEGGMGIVYLAEHITIEKKVALKVLLHDYARKADLKERFLQEAKAAARIGHENIVDITDFGTTPDGSVFFAMEYLEGQDLAKAIRSGPVEWSRAKPILLQICRALGAAHAKGIVHRDMKPENIYLIQREGRDDFVKLLDFGIAKMDMQNGEKRLTRTGMIFGTPEYMSPEQAQGNTPDHRVDIYAVGVIMYEMVTGAVPFKADTFMGILTKHIFENPIPPSQVVLVPAEVEEIVLKAMAKDRAERFQSMTEMATTIAQALGRMTRPTGDHAETPPRRISSPSQTYSPLRPMTSSEALLTDIPSTPRRKLPLIIGALVVLGLAGVATALLLRQPPPAGPARPAGPTKPVVTPVPPHADAAVRTEMVKVTVTSSPAGAQIFRGVPVPGKKPDGVTPGTLSLSRSDRRVALTLRLEGFQDGTMEVVPDRDKEVMTKLTKSAVVQRQPRQPKLPQPKLPQPKLPQPKRPQPKRPQPKHPTGERVDDLMNPFNE